MKPVRTLGILFIGIFNIEKTRKAMNKFEAQGDHGGTE
jgi:hypothetical protein